MCNIFDSLTDIDFIKRLITTILGAGIGAATAILLYIQKSNKDKKEQKKQEDKECQNRVFYIQNLIESFKTQLSNSIKSINTLIEKFENDPISFHIPKIKINETSSTLNTLLKSEKSFQSHSKIFGKKRIDNFVKIRNGIALYEKQMSQFEEINIRALNHHNERIKNFMNSVNTLMNNMYYLMNDNSIPDKSTKDLSNLFNIFTSTITDKERTDIKNYKIKFVDPLFELLLPIQDNQNAHQLITEIKTIKITYDHVGLNNKEHLKNLRYIKENLNNLKKFISNDSYHIYRYERDFDN